jgi:hypothetical protein
MTKLKQNKRFVLIFSYVLLALSLWYVIWSFFDGGILNLRYFTNQSVMIVFATMLLYVTKHNEKPYFKYLAAIALINIFITSTGFHFILSPESVGLQGHLSHTIVPIFYTAFYFIVIDQKIIIQQFWVGVIYPMSYLFLSILMGSTTGFYPYDFINVDLNGLTSVLRFTLALLFPIYTLVAYGLIYLKNKITS